MEWWDWATSFFTSQTPESVLIDLKMTAKQLQRFSLQAEKESKKERAKVKKAIEAQNQEGARIYAQNAIRKKNESINFLRLSSRVEAAASKYKSAITMNSVAHSMAGVNKELSRAMGSMNLDDVSRVMERFERSFEDLDVQEGAISQAVERTNAATMPTEDVDEMMAQMAEEVGIELQLNLPETGKMTKEERDILEARLAQIRRNAELEEDGEGEEGERGMQQEEGRAEISQNQEDVQFKEWEAI